MDDTEDIEEELRLIREEEAEIKRYYDNKEVDKEVTSKVVDKVKKSAPMTEINIPENNSRSRENNSRPRPDKKKSNLSKPIQAQPVHKDVHKSNDRVAHIQRLKSKLKRSRKIYQRCRKTVMSCHIILITNYHQYLFLMDGSGINLKANLMSEQKNTRQFTMEVRYMII